METMRTGTVIEVRRAENAREEPAMVEVLDGSDLQARYDRLLALALRMDRWLTGPRGRLLPSEVWEALFHRYQEHLQQLRDLGNELRPVSLRERVEPLAGDALTSEVAELFAA